MEELAVNLSHTCRDMATVEELVVNTMTIPEASHRGRARL